MPSSPSSILVLVIASFVPGSTRTRASPCDRRPLRWSARRHPRRRVRIVLVIEITSDQHRLELVLHPRWLALRARAPYPGRLHMRTRSSSFVLVVLDLLAVLRLVLVLVLAMLYVSNSVCMSVCT